MILKIPKTSLRQRLSDIPVTVSTSCGRTLRLYLTLHVKLGGRSTKRRRRPSAFFVTVNHPTRVCTFSPSPNNDTGVRCCFPARGLFSSSGHQSRRSGSGRSCAGHTCTRFHHLPPRLRTEYPLIVANPQSHSSSLQSGGTLRRF